MKLLIDHNISFRIAHALNAIFPEHEIVALRDRFPENTPDIDWIKELDEQRAWAVLTRDLRIRTRPQERAAMDARRIVFFFLAGAWRKHDVAETAARLIRWLPKISAQVDWRIADGSNYRSTQDRSYGRTATDPTRFGAPCSARRRT